MAGSMVTVDVHHRPAVHETVHTPACAGDASSRLPPFALLPATSVAVATDERVHRALV